MKHIMHTLNFGIYTWQTWEIFINLHIRIAFTILFTLKRLYMI